MSPICGGQHLSHTGTDGRIVWEGTAMQCGREGPWHRFSLPCRLSSGQRLTSPQLCPEFVESDVCSFGQGAPSGSQIWEERKG